MKRFLLYILALVLVSGNTSMAQSGWQEINTGFSFILMGIQFPDGQNQIGYSAGENSTYNGDGIIIKTTDGGATWTQISGASLPGIEALCFVDMNTGFVGGWQNYFAKTTDGGATWTPIIVDPGIWYIKDIEFWDLNNGIVTAAGAEAYVTNDGGATWTAASGMTSSFESVCYATATTLYGVGGDEKINKSTDGGLTWTEIYSGVFQYMFLGVDFVDENYGMVAGEDGKVLTTSDGGSNWTTSYAGGYHLLHGVHVYNSDSSYVTGTPEGIWKTTDGGTNWVQDYSGGNSYALYEIIFTGDNTGFICGSQGRIFKKEGGLLTASFSADVTSICEGSTVNFTDLSLGAVSSWNWTFEGGTPATSTDQNPTVTYNTAGTYDVELIIGDGANYDTLSMNDYIEVLVTPGQASTPVGGDNACAGSTLNYTTNSVQYATSYQWEVNPADAGTISGTDTVGTFQSSSTFTGSYSIKVRAQNMCGDGAWSAEFQGTLLELPQAYQLEGEGAYCEGSQGSELTLDGSETGIDYELYLDDVATGIIEPGTGSAINFGYQTDEGIYTAVAFTGNCEVDMYGQVWVHMITLPAQAATPEGPEEVCNDTITTYTTTGAADADTLIWTLTPDDAGILTTSGLEATVEWAGSYSGVALLSVLGENECGTGPVSDDLEIEVFISPSPEISGLTLVCEDDVVEYQTNNNSGNSYTWDVEGGVIISGAGTHSVTVQWGTPGTGVLRVTEETVDGCSATTEDYVVTIDECTDIHEVSNETINTFPNPVKDVLTIELGNVNAEKAIVSVFNFTGKKLIANTISVDNKVIKLNTSHLPVGLYVLQVQSTNWVGVSKFEKIR